jgi:putative ABC transport system permease protein
MLQNWHRFACGQGMFANYCKTAFRTIARSRAYSFINIIGLSTGMAFTLVIAAYCRGEWQVNRQLRNADRQYILLSDWKDPNMGYRLATLAPLAKALKENYPTLVANYYRFDVVGAIVTVDGRSFREGLQMGDSTLLSMYGFPLIQGDARTALNEPGNVVITEEKAIKYFGTADVVGRSLTIDNVSGDKKAFRITAVMRESAKNSVTTLSVGNENGVFLPVTALAWFGRSMSWSDLYRINFVELQPGVHPEALAEPIRHLIKTNASPSVAANLHVIVQALLDYYRTTDGGAVQKMIYTLSFIALFIMGMAIVNFVNLSLSRSTLRLKEIGVRRTLGGRQGQLRLQFLTESVVLALLSAVVALGLYVLPAPLFSDMLGRKMPAPWNWSFAFWMSALGLALGAGILAGAYPALLLAALPAVDSLKGKAATVKEHKALRKGLIGFQFGAAMIVFVGALVVSQQIRLFFSDRLGYNKEWIVSSQLPRDWTRPGVQRMLSNRDLLARMPGVKDVTLSFEVPDGMNSGSLSVFREGRDSSQAVVAQALITDAQIPLAAGVFFHAAGEGDGPDSTRVVLNETAARALGWTEVNKAVGQRVHLYGTTGTPMVVSGVVKDFHFDGMAAAIQPEVFTSVAQMSSYRYLSFKLYPGDIGERIDGLQKQWAALMPGAPFEYRFMDDRLRSVYEGELRLRKAAMTATGLAVLIVLLGVIGLVSSSVQRRAKEIAIRKVVGAPAKAIILLFLKEYLPVLLIAGVVASGPTWWIMHRWLDDYATRIKLTPWPFLVALGSLAVVLCGLILGQTLRAALANPVESLKQE